MSDLTLYEGEHVTCEQGHLIGTVVRRCIAGDPDTDWTDAIIWLQRKPVDGGPIVCEECRGRWVVITFRSGREADRKGCICIDREWRPPLDGAERKLMEMPLGSTVSYHKEREEWVLRETA